MMDSGFRTYRPEERRGHDIVSPLAIVEGFLNEDLAAPDDPLSGATMAACSLIAWHQDAPLTGQDQGEWDADTNTPTLASSTGDDGDYYRVSVAGSTELNDLKDWQVGQYLQFVGGIWVRSAPIFFEVDALTDLGEWDANTNDPALASGVGDELDFYRVSVAGTTTLDGIDSWEVGDHLQFKDGAWVKRGPRRVCYVVNRDTSLSGAADYYFQAAKINGELRVLWLSCEAVRT